MVNLQNNRKSYLINESLEFNPDIADDYFTTRYLERELYICLNEYGFKIAGKVKADKNNTKGI